MDETAFRAARGEINRLPCIFEKPLLARDAVCSLALNQAIAERVTVACSSPLARAHCAALLGLLRENAGFALKLRAHPLALLPHAQAMKIQSGGLRGLMQALDPDAPSADVQRLVRTAIERPGGLEGLPWPTIVRAIGQWQGRRRGTVKP